MAATLAVGGSSCSDFLEVDPVGAVSEATLTSKEGVNYAITGMYSSLNLPAATTNSYFGGLAVMFLSFEGVNHLFD